jgi:hypothetical protein
MGARQRQLLPALLAGVVLAGCGEGSGGSATVSPEDLIPNKKGYVSQADGLCAFYQDRIERLGEDRLGLDANDFKVLRSGRVLFKPGRRPSDAELQGFVTEIAAPNLQEQLGELRALTPPRGDDQRVAAVFDAAEAAVDGLAADPRIATDSGGTARLFAPALRAARGYGFRVCGYPPSAVPGEAAR